MPDHYPNPVDTIAQVLAAEGAREPQHAACLVLEVLAASLHARYGGSSATADWLQTAVALRQP